MILETKETAKHYLEKTETSQGPKVVVRFFDKLHEVGRTCAAAFKKTMQIVFDDYLPKWNYTAIPEGT